MIYLHKYYAFDNICVWIKKIDFYRSSRVNKVTLQAGKRKNAASHDRIFTANYNQGNGSKKSFGVFISSQIIHPLHTQSLLFGRSGVPTRKAILKAFGLMKLLSIFMNSVM